MLQSSSVAAALAVLPFPERDDAPRVIQQFTSIFLVNRYGELWRVYDAEASDGSSRHMPSGRSEFPYRVFIALARKSSLRVYTFDSADSRDVDPVTLQAQLEMSALISGSD